MDTTRAQQPALDDELVAPADLALDALKLTPLYNAFEISTDVPEIYIDMLKICPKLPGQIFEEPPLEEEILSFIRRVGHTSEIKFLSDVNVNYMHQPWRSFAAIINKCLSGKTTTLESLCLSRAQILWGMYHNKTVDYVYMLWEDLVYQVENKNSKKNNDMDDFMFTTIRVISKHQDTQTSKPKSTKKKADSESSPKTKLTQASKGKKNQDRADEGTGSIPGVPDVSTYESDDEQISWKSSEEDDDDDDEVNVSEDNDDDADKDDDVDNDDEDDDADNQDDEIPDDANQDDDDDEQTDSDNDGDEFVHPKLSTHDDEARQNDEVNEEESDEEVQGVNIIEEEMDEEATHEEDEANKLYRDVNINLEGRDTVTKDAPLPNVQGTQVTEDTHVIITASINPEGQQQSSSVSYGFVSNMLNPSPNTSIDTIFTLNTEATSLVDVPITTIAKPPLLSATTLPPTPPITHLQQTPVPTPATVPSSSLQDLPNFGSLFGFDHRLKTLETNFSEFKQTNQFAKAVSSIPGIVDTHLANKMHEAVKTDVQLQSERLRDEAQAENADFLNKLDDNIKKIIKDQVKEQVKAQVSKILLKIKKTVNEKLKAEVMTRSSTKSKTSLAIVANLSKLELKKILIDKMGSNKRRDDADKDKEPSAGSNRGSKRRRAGKEPESTSAPKEKTSKTSGKS
ncbi:hypothetical protein Tco_0925796 [Tanacetum coccineum]|uniref:Uncharacterized protein n=1 Tax=Tanacetum coccineum TaxID=301880 RepID=A0ABQ5D966_9ASTR